MAETDQRYLEALRQDQHTRFKAGTMFAATAAGLTIFRRLRRTAILFLALAIVTKPITVATQTFPKMDEAYKNYRQGNPKKAEWQFGLALNQSSYSIFRDFFKPISLGVSLAYLLELPFTLMNEGTGMRQLIIRQVAHKIGIRPNKGVFTPVQSIYKLLRHPVYWGDRKANALRAKVPFINWMEEPGHFSKENMLPKKQPPPKLRPSTWA